MPHHEPLIIGKGSVTYEAFLGSERDVCDVDFRFWLDGGKMMRNKDSEQVNSWMLEDKHAENHAEASNITHEMHTKCAITKVYLASGTIQELMKPLGRRLVYQPWSKKNWKGLLK